MKNSLNRLISMRYVCMVSVIAMFLLLPNQNIFAQSSRKSSKILDAACIYKPNTSFLFKAVYDSCGIVQTEEYILMRILPEIYAGEILILYDYYKNIPRIVDGDSIVNVEDKIWMPSEETILYDHKKGVQLHPPRAGKYYLSQYFPFPKIKLPVKEGRESKLILFNHPDTYKFLWHKYKMRNYPKFQFQYKDNLIDVYEKKGTATSYIGEYTASYLFNEDLGFVKWHLSTGNNVSLEFILIDTYPFLLKNNTQTDNYTSVLKSYKRNSKTKK
ncbi:MAG: hypothetical protein FWF09_02080 [Bacteroidales bacterium]|nr:hypothetical protein [Bacteroidales bacterium]